MEEEIYYFGTLEQIKLLEEMVNQIPLGTIINRRKQGLNSPLHAQLLTHSAIELYPLDNDSLEVNLIRVTCSNCNEDYVDFSFSQYNYRVLFRKKNN